MAKSLPVSERDPDDLFADTRMSFGDHIEELRHHLWRAVFGFLIAMTISIMPPIGPFALHVITKPVEDQLKAFYDIHYKGKWEADARDAARQARPIEMKMRIYLPALKDALAGKAGGNPLERDEFPKALERLKNAFGLDADPAKLDDSSLWATVPVEIPNPEEIAKRLQEINRRIEPEGLTTFNVQEVFFVYIKVGLLVGLVLSSPWVFYQIWAFIAAGLYPSEKRLVNVYLPVSLGLFLTGVLCCQFIALPKAIQALLWFNEWLGFRPDLRLSEWLGFALLFPLVFGISFQTPLVMLFLYRLGIVDVAGYRSKRRISYFLMAVVAMLINPAVDAASMLILWAPMCILYEIGIILCVFQPKPIEENTDDEGGAMIGV